MGNTPMRKSGFEDIQQYIQSNDPNLILINVLDPTDQDILILKTVHCQNEVALVNKAMSDKKCIIVYGYNNNDERVVAKYNQILKLGHANVSVYVGGLFEWLMLNDIYGSEQFPVTKQCNDFYKYRPKGLTYLI